MPIGIRRRVDPALYAAASPEARAIFDLAQEPMEPRTIAEQYAALVGEQEPMPEEAMMPPRIGVPMRNEAGRGTPLIRSDRPYFAPGSMPVEEEVDPWAVTDEMRARQMAALDAAGLSRDPMSLDGMSTAAEMGFRNKTSQKLAGNQKFQSARRNRDLIQKERQANVNTRAAERSRMRELPPEIARAEMLVKALGGSNVNMNPMAAGIIGGPGMAKVALDAERNRIDALNAEGDKAFKDAQLGFNERTLAIQEEKAAREQKAAAQEAEQQALNDLLANAEQAAKVAQSPPDPSVLGPRIGVLANAPPEQARKAMGGLGITPEVLQNYGDRQPFGAYSPQPTQQDRVMENVLTGGTAPLFKLAGLDPAQMFNEASRYMGIGESEAEYNRRLAEKSQVQKLIALLSGGL